MVYKGKAVGYADYYKNNSNTPGGSEDDEDTITPDVPVKRTKSAISAAEKRKAAIKRRLQLRKAGK